MQATHYRSANRLGVVETLGFRRGENKNQLIGLYSEIVPG